MRTIEEQIKSGKKVYVTFKTNEECQEVLKTAEQEGFTGGENGKPTDIHPTDIIAVFPDKKLCYVTTIGRIAIGAKANNVAVIEYGKSQEQ